MFNPGDKLGDFQIESVISDGSSLYTLFKARWIKNKELVALKVLSESLSSNPSFVKRFKEEGIALAKVGEHPHIPKFFDSGEAEGYLYTALELVEGKTLQETLDRKKRLEGKEALTILKKMALGIKFLHDAGIIHRDLQPENVMLTEDGGLKIIDFGFAKIESGDTTRQGEALGTIYFMSPEQLMGLEIDFRSDFYSLGVILWLSLTGNLPFDEDPTTYLAMIHMNEEPPFEALEELGLPDDIRELTSLLMKHSPDERPENIDQVLSAIDICLGEEDSTDGAPKDSDKPKEGEKGISEKTPQVILAGEEEKENWTLYIVVALVVIFLGGGLFSYLQPVEDPYKGLVGIDKEIAQTEEQFKALGMKPRLNYTLSKLPESRILKNRQILYFKMAGDVCFLNISTKDFKNLGVGEPVEAFLPETSSLYFIRRGQLIEYDVNQNIENGLWLLPDFKLDSVVAYKDKIFMVNQRGDLLSFLLKNGEVVFRSLISPDFHGNLQFYEDKIIFPLKSGNCFILESSEGRIESNLELKKVGNQLTPFFHGGHYYLLNSENKIARYGMDDVEVSNSKSEIGPVSPLQNKFYRYKDSLYGVTDTGEMISWDFRLSKVLSSWRSIASPLYEPGFNCGEDFIVLVLQNKLLYYFEI